MAKTKKEEAVELTVPCTKLRRTNPNVEPARYVQCGKLSEAGDCGEEHDSPAE